MPLVPARLHSEFFDLLKRAESILEHKANVSVRTARLILDTAVAAYVGEARQPFYAYLLAELRKQPAIYESISDEALNELLESSDAGVVRQEWRDQALSANQSTKYSAVSFRELVGRIQEN
jgi:hypothetical protein